MDIPPSSEVKHFVVKSFCPRMSAVIPFIGGLLVLPHCKSSVAREPYWFEMYGLHGAVSALRMLVEKELALFCHLD